MIREKEYYDKVIGKIGINFLKIIIGPVLTNQH